MYYLTASKLEEPLPLLLRACLRFVPVKLVDVCFDRCMLEGENRDGIPICTADSDVAGKLLGEEYWKLMFKFQHTRGQSAAPVHRSLETYPIRPFQCPHVPPGLCFESSISPDQCCGSKTLPIVQIQR